MLSQLTTVDAKNQIKPPISPDMIKALGKAMIPGPKVLIKRFTVVDLIPPGLSIFVSVCRNVSFSGIYLT
jgi:hypothetical protein